MRQHEPGSLQFTVPRVRPGRYVVVVFDASEGRPRHHYTWSTFTVLPASSELPVTGEGTVYLVAAGLMVIAIGLLYLNRG